MVFQLKRVTFPILFGLLLLGAGASFFILRTPPPPLATSPSPSHAAQHVYLMDVAGWYEITPNETAVASEFDLALGSMKQLPSQVGAWSGTPYDYGAAVEQWFDNPDLALSTLYSNDQNHQLWFSAFGSAGRKSYVLFEHTPITSYPAAGWTLLDSNVVEIPTGGGSLRVQRALLQKDAERRIVYYWYLWPDTARDPERGIITMRVHVPVVTTDEQAEREGEEFIRALFPQVLPWRRF